MSAMITDDIEADLLYNSISIYFGKEEVRIKAK